MVTFCGQPPGHRLTIRIGGSTVAWCDRAGAGIRHRARYAAWVLPGQWCPLSDRQTPEGRAGRLIWKNKP